MWGALPVNWMGWGGVELSGAVMVEHGLYSEGFCALSRVFAALQHILLAAVHGSVERSHSCCCACLCVCQRICLPGWLAVQDDLVPVRHVEHMVRHETNARIMLNPKMHHADFLFSPATQDKILMEFAEVGWGVGWWVRHIPSRN